MKRAFVATAIVLASLGVASAASAQTQPGQGENSTGRNDAGFGGGPHCHVLRNSNGRFEVIRVFPSHTAHVHSGLADGPFVADPDCDGVV